MKKLIAIAVALLVAGCGHNVSQLELGKLMSIGSPEYGKAKYMEGLAATLVGRENTRVSVSIDSTAGISLDPSSNSLKGIQEITIETGPQCNGFQVDAETEKVLAYFEAVKEYYKDRAPAPTISDEKSKEATKSAADVLKEAVANAYKKWLKPTDKDPFDCPDGNCDIKGLGSDKSVKYQAAVAAKVLTYADPNEKPEEEGGHTMYQNTVAFATRMAKFQFEGRAATKMYIDSVVIKDSKLQKIVFLHDRDDGTVEEITCVECVAFDD